MFAVASVVSCRPPKNKLAYQGYAAAAINHCTPNLQEAIDRYKPKVIVPMGNIALQQVAGVSNILRYRGRVLEKDGRYIVPTLHPRDLLPKKKNDEDEEEGLRNPPRFTGVVIWDLKKALKVATEGFKKEFDEHYLLDPSPEQFAAFALEYEQALAKDGETRLSWDIETPYKLKKGDEDEFEEGERDKQIIRISFCFKPGYAASVPWSGPYLPTIRRLLSSRGPHVVWNGDTFDVPLVRQNGVEVLGRVEDHMWAFHLWQSDLPKGLEWATSFFTDLLPWKHLNNDNPPLYSAIDADAALRNALGIKGALEKAGQWELFQQHVVELDPLLYEAGERGNLIDKGKHEELKAKFRQEKEALIEEVQGMVPLHLHPRKRYKKRPWKDDDLAGKQGDIYIWDGRRFDQVYTQGKVKECSHCGERGVTKGKHFKGGKKNPCKAAGATVQTVVGSVVEWDEILPFNPNSGPQIRSYITAFGHPMGRNKQDRDKEAADSKHLKVLAKRYPSHKLYETTIKIHKVSKGLSTYVIGFTPDEQGLIHTTYDHTPSTWRLASKNVNLQNVGKRDENPYSKEARNQIIARPGFVFVGADSSAIEAKMVGRLMGDSSYEELASKGVHDYLACYELKIPFTPEAIDLYKKKNPAFYKETREKCKRVVHGTNYGMGPKLMVEEYPEIFPTKAEAQRMQDVLFEALPTLKAWQHEIRVRAHKEGYLQSPWGYRHYFYAVFKRDSRTGEVVRGGDSNKAVAFLPQNSAAAFMKDNLLILANGYGLRPYMPANLSVHDGYTYEVPEKKAQETADILKEVLTRPIPQMGGLRVGCEVEVGVNWGPFDEKKNPSGMRVLEKVDI